MCRWFNSALGHQLINPSAFDAVFYIIGGCSRQILGVLDWACGLRIIPSEGICLGVIAGQAVHPECEAGGAQHDGRLEGGRVGIDGCQQHHHLGPRRRTGVPT